MESPLRIAIVGAGGVGGYFGGRLAKYSGANVTFLVREGAHCAALRSKGLTVDSQGVPPFEVNPCQVATSAAEIGEVDVVLVSVKEYQLKAVAPTLTPLLRKSPPTAVVPLLNGLTAHVTLAEVLGKEYVCGGLAKILAEISAPGTISQKGQTHELAFGELSGQPSDRIKALAAAMDEAGIAHAVPPPAQGGIMTAMWAKFIFICGLSGVGAVTRATWGEVKQEADTHNIWKALIKEGMAIGAAHGIRACEGDGMFQKFVGLSETMPAASTASLQRDMMAGKVSELRGQLGHMLALANAKNVSVPVLATVYGALLPQEVAAEKKAAAQPAQPPPSALGAMPGRTECLRLAIVAAAFTAVGAMVASRRS